MNLNKLINIIKLEGYKITKPREAILKTLSLSKNKLLSVENILLKSKKYYTNINLTTVYRNLEMLESLSLIHKSLLKNGSAVYKLKCSDKHHHHLTCVCCGKTHVIDYCPLNALNKVSKKNNFKLIEHKIELFGYCEKCINKNEHKNNPS